MSLNNILQAEEWLDNVEKNKPLNSGFKSPSQYNHGKCNDIVNKARQSENINIHRKMIPKYISYLRLRNIVGIFLFHWIYWRWIYWFKPNSWSHEQLNGALNGDNKDTQDFFASMSLIQTNHLLTTKMINHLNTLTTDQKQDSGAGTIQL